MVGESVYTLTYISYLYGIELAHTSWVAAHPRNTLRSLKMIVLDLV